MGGGANLRLVGVAQAVGPGLRDPPGTFRHHDPLGHDRQHEPSAYRRNHPNLARRTSRTGRTISDLNQMPSQDSGADAGRQVWTIDGNEHGTVLVVGGGGYLKGNAAGLTGFFGFPTGLATRLVGRWISFHPGDSAGGTNYQAVTSAVTLASVADELRLTGPLTLTAPTVAAGQPVVGVHGRVPGHDNPPGSTLTLYVASKGHLLPVTFQTKAAVGQATYRFSRWGEALHLTAPPNSIPAASLSSPGQGSLRALT